MKKRRISGALLRRNCSNHNRFFRLNPVDWPTAQADIPLIKHDPLTGRYRALGLFKRDMHPFTLSKNAHRLIRPAMVVVAAKGSGGQPPAEPAPAANPYAPHGEGAGGSVDTKA